MQKSTVTYIPQGWWRRRVVMLVVVVLVLARLGEGSELPDRECCDSAPPPPPHYHTVTSTSTTTTQQPPGYGKILYIYFSVMHKDSIPLHPGM